MKHRNGRTPALLALLLGLAALATHRIAVAHPEPAIVSPSWNLDFDYSHPRPISITDNSGNVRWFWYLPYKVTNRTGEDRLFVPEVTVLGDTGEIIRAGENVPAAVYTAIEDQLDNPLLESPVEVVGRILQGEDYARESVAIWPHFEGRDVDEMSIFIGGLSGETQSLPAVGDGEPVLLRRTKMLSYSLPGNFPTPQNATIVFENERDVMR